MNLTRLIEITGKRLRLGKPFSDRVTNAEIKEILETAIEVMKEALIEEGRLEIQNFCVLEVRSSLSASGGRRVNWLLRPALALRRAVHEKHKFR